MAKNACYVTGESADQALKLVAELGLQPGDLIERHTVGHRYIVVADPTQQSGLAFMNLDGTAVFEFTERGMGRKLDIHAQIPPHLKDHMIQPDTHRSPRDRLVIGVPYELGGPG